jgi:hypothetical protein
LSHTLSAWDGSMDSNIKHPSCDKIHFSTVGP